MLPSSTEGSSFTGLEDNGERSETFIEVFDLFRFGRPELLAATPGLAFLLAVRLALSAATEAILLRGVDLLTPNASAKASFLDAAS
jgi:hypothetical protein